MKKRNPTSFIIVVLMMVFLFAQMNYAVTKNEKIPITTSSKEALKSFLKGREFFEKLRAQESLQFFQQAVEADPNFGMGYLFLAFTQPSAKGFFENLNKAVALTDKISQGERLWILGVQAGVNAFAMKQREHYQKLVKLYPEDERAHNLLGNHYFGQQEYAQAIESYQKSIKINPDFSQPYNQLGYANRFLEKYAEAEKAFKKYIELIPDDPNPYDSYAELLMKMGKYDASIKFYQKALALNPNFVASHIGIATNLNFKGKYADARKQLQKLYQIARNDGERRAAHFAKTVSYVDEGKMEAALQELKKQYALAEKINDAAAMAGDLVQMGNILLEMGKYDKAMAKFEEAVKIVKASDLAEDVKNNTKRFFHFNTARAYLKQKDFATAKTHSEKFSKQVQAINNPVQIRLSHQLEGMIALAEKDYDKAIEQLKQANQQNPYNLYRMALAYKGSGDKVNAKKFCKKAAAFNALNSLNYAFIRSKAKQMLTSM